MTFARTIYFFFGALFWFLSIIGANQLSIWFGHLELKVWVYMLAVAPMFLGICILAWVLMFFNLSITTLDEEAQTPTY